jgi:hypothetical protein
MDGTDDLWIGSTQIVLDDNDSGFIEKIDERSFSPSSHYLRRDNRANGICVATSGPRSVWI